MESEVKKSYQPWSTGSCTYRDRYRWGPEGGTEVLPPSEMIPATVAVPVSEGKRKTEIPVRRKTSFYYIIGLVVLVAVIAFIYIIRKGEDRAVNIPAIKEMTLSGQVAGKEVQMALTQIGDFTLWKLFL